jgi:hypothetical protein
MDHKSATQSRSIIYIFGQQKEPLVPSQCQEIITLIGEKNEEKLPTIANIKVFA